MNKIIVPKNTSGYKKYKHDDFIGKRYGFLVVDHFHSLDKWGRKVWFCKCDCGGTKIVSSARLQSKNVRSCGCYRKMLHRKHYYRGTKVYTTWRGLHTRCYNPKCPKYKYYGGKGIKVCKRWSVFLNFLEDMGEPPTKNHTLDRINGDKDYCKLNCRWASWSEQQMNKKTTTTYQYNGITKSKKQWLKEIKISRLTFNRYINEGYTFDQIYIAYKNKTNKRNVLEKYYKS